MNDFQAHGSTDLTPAAIRAARFRVVEQGFAAGDVVEFLDQVASAMDVLASTDAAEAMRRELQRNVEISSRMIAAGQSTAEGLRNQAATEARAIIDDTKQLAEQLRDSAREEVRRTQAHIDELRGGFIEELREMYDRLGASLYRFEAASRSQQAQRDAGGEPAAGAPAEATGDEPAPAGSAAWPGAGSAGAGGASASSAGGTAPTQTADGETWSPMAPATHPTADAQVDPAAGGAASSNVADLPGLVDDGQSIDPGPGGLAPAWAHNQEVVAQGEAPPLQWQHADVGWQEPEHDEPDIELAPGEPLVDLRGLGDVPPAEAVADFELDLGDGSPTVDVNIAITGGDAATAQAVADEVAVDAAMLVETALEAAMPGSPAPGIDPAVEAIVADVAPDGAEPTSFDSGPQPFDPNAAQPADPNIAPPADPNEVPLVAQAEAGGWLDASPEQQAVPSADDASWLGGNVQAAVPADVAPPAEALVEELPAAIAPPEQAAPVDAADASAGAGGFAQAQPAGQPADAGASEVVAQAGAGEQAVPAAGDPGAQAQPGATELPPADDPFGSSWLPAAEPEPVAPSADPEFDDARAEALIAGVGDVLSTVTEPQPPLAAQPAPQVETGAPQVAPLEVAPLPDPPQLSGNGGGQAAQVDPDAVRNFVLQAVFDGSPRDQIEVHLGGMGIADPGGVIDGILADQQPSG